MDLDLSARLTYVMQFIRMCVSLEFNNLLNFTIFARCWYLGMFIFRKSVYAVQTNIKWNSSSNTDEKERNVLLHDALNTFYLRHRTLVNDHSDNERGNPLLPLQGLMFSISNQTFCMQHPTDMTAHTTACVIPVVEYWLERETVQWVYHEGSIRWPIAHERTFYHGATSRFRHWSK